MQGHGHDESAPTPCGVFVGCFVCECGHFAVCFVVCFVGGSLYIHGTFATCSLSVCYIITIQKHGFCNAKVWFLACKSMVFVIRKYGSCFCYAIVCITNNKVCVFRFLYLPLQLKRKLQRHNGRTPHCL